MMKFLISFSLHNKLLVVVLALCLTLLGFYAGSRMPIDVLPDLNRPTVVLIAEAHDLTTEKIEQQVTIPIERAVNGVPGVERVQADAGKGMAIVKIEFGWGSDLYRRRQIIAEKMTEIQARIPADVKVQIAPISSVMGQIQLIGLTSKSGKTSLEELSLFAQTRLKYELLSVPGVSKIISAGAAPRQLQVVVDADKLRACEVTLPEVEAAIRNANVSASGGTIDIGSHTPMITLSGSVRSPEELRLAHIKDVAARPVLLKDVADIKFGPSEIKTGEAGVNGKPGVVLVLMKQPTADTVTISRQVEALIRELRANINPDIEINLDLFSQRDFIERALANLEAAVRDGALLVVVVLFIFLMNWRTTLITLTAIPVSVAITAIIFAACGLSFNTMTLGGLAVGIGSLVDDAVVDVENCFRRLRQNQLRPPAQRLAPLKILFDASCEVRAPILIGTLLVIVVYLPLFFLSGMEGRLFIPIGLAYIVSVAASLLVAMTVTVALCAYLLPDRVGTDCAHDSFVVTRLKRVADRLILFSTHHAKAVLGVFAVLVVAGLGLLATTGKQFLPEFNEGVAQINVVLPPETGLKVASDTGFRAEELFLQIKGVKAVSRRTGRAAEDEHAHGVNQSDCIITFDPAAKRSREAILRDVRATLDANLPGVTYDVEQPLAHLISAMLSGAQSQVAVKIYGTDLAQLRALAAEVNAAIKPIPGVKDLKTEQQLLIPLVDVVPDRARLAQHGLTVDALARTIELAMGNDAVSEMIDGQNNYPVVIRLRAEQRNSLTDIGNLTVANAAGAMVHLRDVATVRQAASVNSIRRENNARRLAVTHNIAGRPLSEVVADLEKALAPIRKKINAMPNYRLKIAGQFEAQQQASRYILGLSVISLALMVLILFLHFKSLNLACQVLASIPMALIGAVAFIKITGQAVSISTMVGLIALAGIASRNAILLINHYLHLLENERRPFSIATISLAGQERLTPVLMTALCSGIALVPLVFNPSAPGKEILYPVASVIIGGLVSSTILDFTVRPALFWLFGRKAVATLIPVDRAPAQARQPPLSTAAENHLTDQAQQP
jgi:CzcA family heavy metal efflux pump